MKNYTIISFIIFVSSHCFAQPLIGIVIEKSSAYKSKDKKIRSIQEAWVESLSGYSKPTKSISDGTFTLIFSGLPIGETVILDVRKKDMIVTNREALKQGAVIGKKDTLIVEMSYSNELEAEKKFAREVIEKEIKQKYERRIKAMREKSSDMMAIIDSLQKETGKKINTPQEALSFLLDFRDNNVDELVLKYTNEILKQNLDFASQRYRQAHDAIFIQQNAALALKMKPMIKNMLFWNKQNLKKKKNGKNIKN